MRLAGARIEARSEYDRCEYCIKYCFPVRLWEVKYSLQSAEVQRLGLREQRTIARGFYLNLIFYVEAGGL